MTIVRLSTGFGTIILSVFGLLLCIAGIVGLWAAMSRVDTARVVVFGTADEALTFVGNKLDRVRQTVDDSQQRVGGLSRIADRLKNAEADVSKESQPLLQTIDEVFYDLKSAEAWLDASHAVAIGVGKVSDAVVSSEYAATHQDSAGIALASKVQEFSENVTATRARLQAIRQEVIELRDKGQLTRQLAVSIISRVADLSRKLANLSTKIGQLNANVAATKASCAAFGEKVRWWATIVEVICILVLLWFGISQIGMMKHGWRLALTSSAPGEL